MNDEMHCMNKGIANTLAVVFIILTVTCILIANPVYASSGDYWVKRTPMPDLAHFVNTAVINGQIFAIGSNNTANTNYNYLYDPRSDSWVSKTPILTVQHDGAIATYKNKIYMIGGGQGITPNITTYQTGANTMYDPDTDTWTSKTPMPMGYANLKAATVDGIIYVMGGTTVASMKMSIYGINEQYNPVTDSWQSLTPMPIPVYDFGMVAIGTKIYVLGGLITSQTDPSNKTQIYDTQTDTWSFGSPMPITTCGGTAAAIADGVDSKIYYIGNEMVLKYNQYIDRWLWDFTYNSPTQMQTYDLQTGNWTVGASSPTPRISGESLAVVNKTIYAIGGYDGIGQTSANEQYFPATGMPNPIVTATVAPTFTAIPFIPTDRNASNLEPIDYLLLISVILALIVIIIISILLFRRHRKTTYLGNKNLAISKSIGYF